MQISGFLIILTNEFSIMIASARSGPDQSDF